MFKIIKKTVATSALAATVMTTGIAIAPQAMANGYGYACTVNPKSSVHIRVNAGQNYRVIAGIPNGRGVRILNSKIGTDGGLWYFVQYGKYRGWSHSAYIC